MNNPHSDAFVFFGASAEAKAEPKPDTKESAPKFTVTRRVGRS